MPVEPLNSDDPRQLGDIELTGRLGAGGQGVVYAGRAPTGERVAVKVLKADPQVRERLTRELAALRRVAPFCTARVLAASTDAAKPYVVSEYVDGPSLQERVRATGPLREGELDRLLVGTASALAAIHGAGVVHRDFKPGNVLLGPDGPRVVDFGIARPMEADTITSGLIGTPAYLAPEQIQGEPASPASDVFAWASTMVFAACGRPPFGNDVIPAVLNRIINAEPDLSGVSVRLRGVLAECLDKDRARRPTAKTLMLRLVDPVAHPHIEPATQPPMAVPDQGTQPVDRSRRGLVVAAALVVTSLLALAVVAWIVFQPRPKPDNGTAGKTGRASATPEPITTTAATAGGTIPSSFAGTWTGQIDNSNPLAAHRKYEVRVVIKSGPGPATWHSTTYACGGELRIKSSTRDVLVFDKTVTNGDCVPGEVTLTKKGDTLSYSWRDALGLLNDTGDLRQGG